MARICLSNIKVSGTGNGCSSVLCVDQNITGNTAVVYSDFFLLAVFGLNCIWVSPLSTFVWFRVFRGRKIDFERFIGSRCGVILVRSMSGGQVGSVTTSGQVGDLRTACAISLTVSCCL